jgi:hypothetical protein
LNCKKKSSEPSRGERIQKQRLLFLVLIAARRIPLATISATATLLALLRIAKAQVLVYGAPINLDSNLSMSVVTDGNNLKMDSNITVGLRNIQGTLTATLPTYGSYSYT